MFDLTGKTALVTGASGGIGRAIAAALYGQGATLVISGTRRDALDALAGDLGERVHVVPCDLSDTAAVEGLVPAAEAAAGTPVDILVNNAGITRRADGPPRAAGGRRRLCRLSRQRRGRLRHRADAPRERRHGDDLRIIAAARPSRAAVASVLGSAACPVGTTAKTRARRSTWACVNSSEACGDRGCAPCRRSDGRDR